MTTEPKSREFGDDLYQRICSLIEPGAEIATLSNKCVNRIAAVERRGIYVETARSDARGSGPQLVPAWMVVRAWEHLCRERNLSQVELLNDLNVKRSAFVFALLALFPEVVIKSTNPGVLELIPSSQK